MPSNFKVYDNYADLQKQLDVDGYDKPSIFSKIHDTFAVFRDAPGKVTFLYDPENKLVSLVLSDGNDKVISIQSQSLVELSSPPKGYDPSLTLNRNNLAELQAAQSAESIKAIKSMMNLYGRDYILQYGFLGSK
jgi:hypothetical protein